MTDPDSFAGGVPKKRRRRDNTLVFEGARVGKKFRLLEPLGDGGMGKVWLAQHLGLGRPVALKVLHRAVHAQADHRRRFEREARAIGQLQHPGIVAALDFGELEDGRNFLAMELVHGRTLARILDQGALPWEVAVRLLADVADAIAFAHARGVLHRDLKPDNLMIEGGDPHTGRPRILDLGLARIEGVSGTSDHNIVFGTANYSAPEQLRGQPTDERSDVYGLAAVLYHCLAGQPPYPGLTMADVVLKQHRRELVALAEVRPDPARPAALDALVMRALAHDADRRPSSAAELATALRAVLTRPARAHPGFRRLAWGAGLVALGVAAGMFGAMLLAS